MKPISLRSLAPLAAFSPVWQVVIAPGFDIVYTARPFQIALDSHDREVEYGRWQKAFR